MHEATVAVAAIVAATVAPCIHYSVTPKLNLSSDSITRGNSFKIINRRCHYDLRKYSFCNRVTNLWNSLLEAVVAAQSLNIFNKKAVLSQR